MLQTLEYGEKYVIRNFQWNILLEKDKAVTDNSEIFKTVNGYFANLIKSFEIPESENIDQLYERIQTLTLKAIVGFRKHLIINAINDSFEIELSLFLSLGKRMLAVKSVSLILV